MISTTQANVNFRHLFKDIVFGWSAINYRKSSAYLKHLSVFDQVDIEEVRNAFYEKAKTRGLPTKAESLNRLKEEELWLPSDEAKITEQEKYLSQVKTTKKELYLKAEIDRVNEEIFEAQKKISFYIKISSTCIGRCMVSGFVQGGWNLTSRS